MKTNEEIDTIKNAVLHHLESLYQKREISKVELGSKFVSVLAMLKKTNKLVEIYNDKVLFELKK